MSTDLNTEAAQLTLYAPGSLRYQEIEWRILESEVEGLVEELLTVQDIEKRFETCARLLELNLYRAAPLLSRTLLNNTKRNALACAGVLAAINMQLPKVGKQILQAVVKTVQAHAKEQGLDKNAEIYNMIGYSASLGCAHVLLLAETIALLAHHRLEDLGAQLLARFSTLIKTNSEKTYDFLYEKLGCKVKSYESLQLDAWLFYEPKKQTCHDIRLDEVQPQLSDFLMDTNWFENEEKYEKMRVIMFGASLDGGTANKRKDSLEGAAKSDDVVEDYTKYEEIQRKKEIYLTIMSAMSADEIAHKLVKQARQSSQAKTYRREVVGVLLVCCMQSKPYDTLYANVCYRLCRVASMWRELIQEEFRKLYDECHEHPTMHIRNIGRCYGSLLATKSVDWSILSCASLIPEESTPSTRILLQSLFGEIKFEIGLSKLKQQIDAEVQLLKKLFPHDSKTSLQFSINFFTAIGLGKLSDDMRKRYESITD